MNATYIVCLFILSLIASVISDNITITDNEYELLPPVFHIDPYNTCIEKQNIFCKVTLHLTPLNASNPSKVWKLIEKTKRSKRYYNHAQLYHGVCIINDHYQKLNSSKDKFTLKRNISTFYANKYKELGLEANVEHLSTDNFQFNLKIFDVVLLFLIIAYLLLIAIATIWDIKTYPTGKYLILFSLRHNFSKAKQTYHQTKFQKLRCVQGIRFYTTVLIIFCHTFCSFAGGYIADTKYLEDIPLNYIKHGIRNLFVFLVQTFFLISAWLLSYRTFKACKEIGRINYFKYAGLTLCRRYLRLIPPVLLMVSLGSSIWIYGNFKGPLKDIYSDREYQRCQKTWWTIFLFISNHYQQQDMCYFTNWYLSADTQLYALSLVVLTITLKFKNFRILILTTCFLASIVIQSIISYVYELDIIYRISPENSKNDMFRSFEFNATYTSTYTNMGTYMLGLIFGYIYFLTENKVTFTRSKFHMVVCYMSSIGLPTAVIIITFFEYNRVTSALLAGILKPMYALGIGIGILGMSQKVGGLLKTLCEWKPALFLGSITYSTYVVHFAIVFSRTALTYEPLKVSDYILFTSFLQDTILSFICGYFMHLTIEMPASQLQNMILPKFSPRRVQFNIKQQQ